MKISELIKELEKLKGQYGDLNVIYGTGSYYQAEYVEPQKYVKYMNDIWDEMDIETEDINENYLEETYKGKILDKGITVLIY